MGNIGEELKKSLNKLGITRQVEAVGVVERAQEELSRFLSEEDFEVVSFNRGILKISVKSSAAASEVNMKTSEIKRNIPDVSKVNIKTV